MKRSTVLGTQVEEFTENNKRYIDEEKDIYPPPLMTSCPSSKVNGFDKLLFPLIKGWAS